MDLNLKIRLVTQIDYSAGTEPCFSVILRKLT